MRVPYFPGQRFFRGRGLRSDALVQPDAGKFWIAGRRIEPHDFCNDKKFRLVIGDHLGRFGARHGIQLKRVESSAHDFRGRLDRRVT